jgi:hypothetical protein
MLPLTQCPHGSAARKVIFFSTSFVSPVCTNEPTSELFCHWYHIYGRTPHCNSPGTSDVKGWLSALKIDPDLTVSETNHAVNHIKSKHY